ncbi:hypothetical protein BDP27DRAFT_1417104 [Rhodocollybia butyracea]|uniref:Uncharacterized protein n=1 Tax=Rhodocollybia butyracea TaxID=206335 RepID=A0A9P5Q2R9_9AGAR|nr:hypothetical protein BDP27DRAFT_1417104 [Rhodocollybia butyracea]
MFHIDDLVNGLACFPSLRILSLRNVFEKLYSECEDPLEPLRETKSLDWLASLAAKAEPAVMWYASKIAKGTSLEAWHIYQRSYAGGPDWCLHGWLEVTSSRDLVGALKILASVYI